MTTYDISTAKTDGQKLAELLPHKCPECGGDTFSAHFNMRAHMSISLWEKPRPGFVAGSSLTFTYADAEDANMWIDCAECGHEWEPEKAETDLLLEMSYDLPVNNF